MTTLFIGLTTLDIQYYVPRFPESNVKVKSEQPDLLVGGPATNAAVAHSFLGGRSVLCSGVGESAFSNLFRTDFSSCKIEHIDFHEGQQQLPVLASVITSTDNGDRNIFTSNPVAKNIELDASKIIREQSPDVVMIDGFYPEVAIPLCKLAKEQGIPVVFDGGSWKPHLKELLPFVDYAICSANFMPPQCSSEADLFHILNKFGVHLVAITKGADQIYFCSKGKTDFIDIKEIEAVDTLGAGDFFHGAFCYYIQQEKSFHDALRCASVLASKTCQYRGTRSWLNKMKKDIFIQSQFS